MTKANERGYQIHLAASAQQAREALQLMLGAVQSASPASESAESEQSTQTSEIDSAEDLAVETPGAEWLIAAGSNEADPTLAAALLFTPQADHNTTFWPPVSLLPPREAEQVCRALLARLHELATERRWNSLQALLSPKQKQEQEWLISAGIPRVGELLFMQRSAGVLDLAADSPATVASRADIKLLPVGTEHASAEFAELLFQTYQNSADFPKLLDQRSGLQSLASHRLQGVFRPDLWFRLQVDQHDCGVLLLAEHPDWNQWELVYLGILPAWRGQKWARYAMEQILSNEEIGGRAMFLGVDAGNEYAVRLYKSLGFVATSRQVVHFRWLTDPGT